ncbi:speckle-type POZ protein B [Trichonephila inaurata madagascariensis]|uniref:Speckle-type POZ protein B n=1 Tax=Trichonephila inaurata madagascariensis TaxID=2747483 RepID=A0A8X7CFB5_9ARAC|nr:speckle-type POZ protein B [Trichonephila inaurata madagascariensis]
MNVHEEMTQLSTEHTSVSENEVADPYDPIDFFIVTRVPVKTYRFKWILNQFSNISSNEELYSCIHSSRYRLKLIKYENGFGLFHVCPKQQDDTKETVNNSQIISVFSKFQTLTSSSDLSLGNRSTEKSALQEDSSLRFIEYEVSAIDKYGRERIKWTACFSETHEHHFIGVFKNNSSEKIFEDVLTLYCCMKVTKIPETEKQNLEAERSLQNHCWQKLSQDLKFMYKNSSNADFILIVETEEILVNSSILAARSSVFKKMLHHDKEQKVQNPVAITDVPLPAMKRLVQFLYTGSVEEAAKDIPLQEVYDLYYAADKYEVMDLRKMCGTTLMSKASADNANQILLWADRHSDEDLKSQALNFIRLNFETVVDSDVWRHFTDNETKLANEALSFCAHKFKAGVGK